MLAIYFWQPNLSVGLFFLYSCMNGYGAGGQVDYDHYNAESMMEGDDASSRQIQRHGSDEGHASGRNAPRPNGFMINSRGRKLYYRVIIPKSQQPTCLVILLHGYAAHFNRPGSVKFVQELLARNFAVATMDFEGHGYSEGLRCYVKSTNRLVQDVEQFVELIMSGSALISSGDDLYSPHTASGFNEKSRMVAKLPFFISGQSMGGAIALLSSEKIAHRGVPFPNWRGAMLLCPALDGNKPPAMVVYFLRLFVVPFFPTRTMPTFLDSTSDASAIWKTKSLVQWHENFDGWGKPGALGWGENMRWGTGGALIEMIDDVQAVMKLCDFSVLSLHDPKDGIIPFAGTLKLKKVAPSKDISCVEMHGALHDMVTNEPGVLAGHMSAWANQRLKSK